MKKTAILPLGKIALKSPNVRATPDSIGVLRPTHAKYAKKVLFRQPAPIIARHVLMDTMQAKKDPLPAKYVRSVGQPRPTKPPAATFVRTDML